MTRSLSIRGQPAGGARPLARWRTFMRRPFDTLWGLFGSVRTAIVLIVVLLLICTVGVFVTQAPREVVAAPQDYASWLQANARMEYGNATDLMNWLQLFTIFTSWYFKLLVVLLAINILVGGMLNRMPGIWQKFRHPSLRRNDGFYVNSPVKVGVTVEAGGTTTATAAHLRQFFARRGFRVAMAPSSNDEATYLYVHKHTWSMLATFVFHTSLIATMLSAVLTGWGGFGSASSASRLLPRPIFAYFQNLAGFSYTAPMPDGSMGVVYPLGTPHNIMYRAQQFVMTVDPQRMMPTDFYTDLQVFQDGKLVAAKRIRVNDPLTYQGVSFHQASFMMYTSLSLRDASGQVVYSGPIPLFDQRTTKPDPNSGNVLQTNNAENVPLANYGATMNVGSFFIGNNQWVVGIKGFDTQQKLLFQGAGIYNGACVDSATNAFVASGTYGCKLSNGWWMQITALRRGTVLLVTKDAGSPLLWPVLALLVLSLYATFGFPPRRFWVQIQGDQVRMAALKEHTINLQRDLDTFARALGNIPLRPAAPEAVPVKRTTKKESR